jgi:hypothetical protein
MMNKLTVDEAINQEAMNLADALASGCLELNDEFLSRHFSKECAEILMRLECRKEREMVIDSHLADDNWRGMVGFDEGSHINLPIGEIEIQFEGKAEDYFEEPSEWYIKGDLAYLALDGICWTFDLEELKNDVNDWLAC